MFDVVKKAEDTIYVNVKKKNSRYSLSARTVVEDGVTYNLLSKQ